MTIPPMPAPIAVPVSQASSSAPRIPSQFSAADPPIEITQMSISTLKASTTQVIGRFTELPL